MPVKKATKTKKPLKILLYGASGVGKTHFALYATPGETLVFDMEGGTDLFEGRVNFDYWTDSQGYKTQSFAEVRKCIEFLKTPAGRQYKTFIFDPISLIWSLLQSERQDYKEEKHKNKTNQTDLETFTTRDWNIVKKMHKNVIDALSALPQNVILIAREKPVVEMKGGEPINTGEFTFEAEKNTVYAVDFCMRLGVNRKSGTRFIQIDKDRSGNYATGTILQDPTFAMFDQIVNGMADGEEALNIQTGEKITFDEEKPAAPKNHPTQIPKENTNNNAPMDEKFLSLIYNMGSKKGMEQEDLYQLAASKFGVSDLKDLTRKQGQELLVLVQKSPESASVGA